MNKEEQIKELEEQIKELKKQIKDLKPQALAYMVRTKPLDVPRNLENDLPIFGYKEKLYDHEVWKFMLNIAKRVHIKSPEFYMTKTYEGKPYIRFNYMRPPKKIDELTKEQKEISAKMLEELATVYNKYFMQLHQWVYYVDEHGNKKRFFVEPPLREKGDED